MPSLRSLIVRPGVWIALALALGAGALYYVMSRPPAVRTTTAVRRAIEQHLVASGRVRVPVRVQVSAQVAGQAVAVAAVEGQRVAAGDLLVQLDDAAARAAVAQAQAAVKQAQAKVDQLRRVGAIVTTQGLREAESNLERARLELDRVTGLYDSGAVALSDVQDARHALDVARAQRDAAAAQQVAAAPAGADSRVALAALLQAQAQLAGAEVQLAQTRIVALHAGTVLERDVEPGDVVQPSRTLLVVAADADVELVFQPDERNLASIALGQVAVASADAFPERTFEAHVSYIAPSIDPARGSVEVRLAVPAPPPELRPDMTVSIDLTVAAKADALTVPSDVVRGMGGARPYVLAVERGRVVRRDVRLGVRGDGSVEIVDGLDEATVVIASSSGRTLAPGDEVRVERD